MQLGGDIAASAAFLPSEEPFARKVPLTKRSVTPAIAQWDYHEPLEPPEKVEHLHRASLVTEQHDDLTFLRLLQPRFLLDPAQLKLHEPIGKRRSV
jgi:hypothetical protein